jgi:hypothetical protein
MRPAMVKSWTIYLELRHDDNDDDDGDDDPHLMSSSCRQKEYKRGWKARREESKIFVSHFVQLLGACLPHGR